MARGCLPDLALALHVGRADCCPGGPAAGGARQAEGRRKSSRAWLKCGVTCRVCELQGDNMLMGDRSRCCAHPLSLWTSPCLILMIMSRNWSTGKLSDLSDVTEKACGKARNRNQLSWSQVNRTFKPFLWFQCTWPFPCVIPHRGTNAIQLQTCNFYLWLAGHFGLRKAWLGRGWRSLIIFFLLAQFICFCSCSPRKSGEIKKTLLLLWNVWSCRAIQLKHIIRHLGDIFLSLS